ncbi:MAG: hypothetical protein ACFB02_08460 [Mastigocoleus sp.]
MAKRDFSNRVSISKQLVEPLLQKGSRYHYDLSGIVDYALRLYLADEIHHHPTVDIPTVQESNDLDGFNIDLAA